MTTRKRIRPDPSNNNERDTLPSASSAPAVASLLPSTSSSRGMPPAKPDCSNTPASASSSNEKKARKTNSWYGSWPRVSKSPPSTQVARENIMGDTRRSEAAADFSRFEANKKETHSDSDGQPTATPGRIAETDTELHDDQSVSSAKPPESVNAGDGPSDSVTTREPVVPSHTIDNPSVSIGNTSQVPTSSTGWLPSWLSGSTAHGQSEPAKTSVDGQKNTPDTAKSTQPQDVQAEPSPETSKVMKHSGPWFSIWSSSAESSTQKTTNEATVSEESNKTQEIKDVVMRDAPTSADALPPPPAPSATQPSTGSTWAFWSRESTSRKVGENVSTTEQGELAVMGDGSETSPRKSGVEVNGENRNKDELPTRSPQKRPSKDPRTAKAKRSRPQSMDLDDSPTIRPNTPNSGIAVKNIASKSATTLTHKVLPPNLLLPSFKSTYRMKENPWVIKKITQLLFRTQQPPPNHVYLSKETPTIKKAMAIGVHGLFPASYLRPMIGQPTGTSIKFANHCAEAIRKWAGNNGCSDCEIEKVALEGEGKIADRVNNLWKLLLNWIEHIKNADLIMVACHSQGVPVGIMLLAKLIDLGVITTSRIGVCAMAGVSLGPFPDYKSGMGMLMGSAAELWQFADPASEISKRYEQALKTVVEYGARITYVGSIDDQLVPLESALHGNANHPYIFRAVFIDGRNHAPDFIAHLVGFALRLRNMGISDHGLIRELSVPLAGSLYSGEGHSRLYDDDQVYDLAIMHTLETTSISRVPCEIQRHQGLTSPNPYVLPWIMRGILEEEFVKQNFEETAELLKQFDDWTPTTKALKDVKYRLEAVRSKL
ncbi:hypothetical protein F5Y03DRAFT_344491 [Xylaria venustula]|nr:hypothetical protein F5Y03DRAFT_344491 [Xylaria venustula]